MSRGLGDVYKRQGFDLVLGIGAAVAALGAVNTLAISALVTGAERGRAAARAEAARLRPVVQPAE